MEAFALLKFWKTSNSKVAAGAAVIDGETTFSDPFTEESDDDDDSFFELELTMPNNYDSKSPKPDVSTKKFEQEREIEPQPTSKPQSPISILRSAPPKLKVFMFGKLNRKKSSKQEDFEIESLSSPNFSPRGSENNNSNLFTVKFKIEDGSIVPKFTRSNSSSLLSPNESYETSRRFSKDVVQKYLNLIKPRSSKKYSETEKFAPSPTRSTTASFPSPSKEKEEKQSSRFKVKCKQLGKSKSASSIIGAPSPLVRNDHPLDGIEGAILHCKRSLTSSKGHSSLSRCSSDPSHEKSIQVSERSEGRREEN